MLNLTDSKKNIFYFVVFLFLMVSGGFMFYIYYQETYVKLDSELVSISVDNEYWTTEDVVVTVDYQNKDIKVSKYSFDGGKTWQKENQYTVTENKALKIVLKTSNGKKSEVIPYLVENIDREAPIIQVQDVIYVVQGSAFTFDGKYTVTDSTSGIRGEVQIEPSAIDTSAISSYEVEISAVDKAYNSDTKKILVEVLSPKDPRLQLMDQNGNIPVTGLTLTSSRLSLVKGTTASVQAIVKPASATNKKVIWTSSNEEVATVNNLGVITAIKAGSVTIKATTEDGNKSSEIKLTVTDEKVESTKIVLDRVSDVVTTTHGNIKLVATISPENTTDQSIKWNSSNPNVAVVVNGVVTIRGEGMTTITATTSNGKVATYALTVADEYTFQAKEIHLDTGELMGYTIKIYQNGVDITKGVTVITEPFTVRNDSLVSEIEISVSNYSLLKDTITFQYKSKKHIARK